MNTAISFAPAPLAVERAPRAVVTLLGALSAGTVTQALFWSTGVGLNFFVWTLLLVGANVAAYGSRPISPTTWGAIAAAVLLAGSVVLYASTWTLAIAAPADVAVLMALPFLLRDPLTLSDLASVPCRAIASVIRVPRATRCAARLLGDAFGSRGSTSALGLALGVAAGVPTAGLFALLLGSDVDFVRALASMRDRLSEATLFVAWSLATAIAYLVGHALHARGPYGSGPAPLATGPDVSMAAVAAPYRVPPEASPSRARAPLGRVSTVAWTTIVAQVATVFGVFVAANLRHMFGGHGLVRSPGSLTYATYLHAGFAQLLVAIVLAVCLVLVGHALLRRDRPTGTARAAGGTTLKVLEVVLLLLSGVTVASCWQRLTIYEDAYGATRLRLAVAVIEAVILGVLLLTSAKVIAHRWKGYGGSIVAFATGVAVFASGINADAYVATTNLDRAARGKRLDVEYLASLSVDARQALKHPVVRNNPELAELLEARFCRARGERSGLRSLRGLGSCGESQ
jgi:hypothetical protein